jgi:hypothetical protein
MKEADDDEGPEDASESCLCLSLSCLATASSMLSFGPMLSGSSKVNFVTSI